MAAIPRALIDALTEKLDELSEAARRAVSAQLEAIDYTDVADLREKVIAIIDPVCSAATDYAAALTAEFYDEAREIAGAAGDYAAEALSGRVPERTDGAVRGMVAGMDDGAAWGAFAQKVLDRVDYEIKRASNSCAIQNAERDPAHPRWARVPTGAETCGFCIMLASRGYDYLKRESADHAHPNCDCRVVPQFGAGAIEGYDPDHYLDIYERNVVMDDAGTVNINATTYAIEKDIRLMQWRERETARADAFGDRIKSAKSLYVSSKTKDIYDATIGRAIAEIGSENGIDLSGEYLSGKGRSPAVPDGDEIWAIVTAKKAVGSGMFVGQDKTYGGNPDFLSDGMFLDIKTPSSLNKVGRRLNHAAHQCKARGQDSGVAVLSSLRYEGDDFSDAVSMAEEFVRSGTLSRVIAILPGGEIKIIQ